MTKLTALKIQKVKHPGNRAGPFMVSDGLGLSLQIMPGGSKSWVLRFMIGGKARSMGLGAYSDHHGGVSLATARDLAAAARSLVKQGIDPIEARATARLAEEANVASKQAQAQTFEAAANDYISGQEAGWENAKHKAQWSATLKTYAFPKIGNKPVGEITADDLEAILKPIWLEKTETASRLRGRLEAILDFAKAKGWRTGDNPARWQESLKHRLPAISRVRRTRHHPALSWQRLPAFMTALKARDGVSSRALLFCILNASRSGEVRGARWSEIDLDNRVWTVPAARMKAKREHRVPLSDAAVDILKSVELLKRGADSLLFPSIRKGAALTDMAMSQLLRGMNEGEAGEPMAWIAQDGRPVVVHGFRSTFRDWCEEATSTPHAVSEAALAHVVSDKVEAAYRRTDLFEKRSVVMQQWADHCMSEG